jgi:hypothetical protein
MVQKVLSDEDWRARSDAETLAQAEQIKGDPNRLKRASTAAEEIAKERYEGVKEMAKVAKRGTTSKESPVKESQTAKNPLSKGNQQMKKVHNQMMGRPLSAMAVQSPFSTSKKTSTRGKR